MITPPPPVSIAGIPIVYDAKGSHVARAAGLWPFKRIVVGPLWRCLPQGEQVAVLWHEVRHCQRLHIEKRLLLLPFFWTALARRVAHAQEHECDAYAASKGFGREMAAVCRRLSSDHADDPYHPTPSQRAAHLSQFLQGEKYEAAS